MTCSHVSAATGFPSLPRSPLAGWSPLAPSVAAAQDWHDAHPQLALSSILRATPQVPSPSLSEWLRWRQHVAGATSLSASALDLLLGLAAALSLSPHELAGRVHVHPPTRSAAQTQAALPPGVFVQKTVSLLLDGSPVLVTGLGDFHLSQHARKRLADALGVPRRHAKQAVLNPPDLDPVEAFGMAAGMISPFVDPRRAGRVRAVAVHSSEPPPQAQARGVAISLSLRESLLLPAAVFPRVLFAYLRAVYPPSAVMVDLIDENQEMENTHDRF